VSVQCIVLYRGDYAVQIVSAEGYGLVESQGYVLLLVDSAVCAMCCLPTEQLVSGVYWALPWAGNKDIQVEARSWLQPIGPAPQYRIVCLIALDKDDDCQFQKIHSTPA